MAKLQIVFLLLPEIHLLDLAGADQVFHEAIEYDADINIEYCCLQNNLKTSTSLPIGNIKHFSEISFQSGDYLIVPGAKVSCFL
jgi:hypothetical protein